MQNRIGNTVLGATFGLLVVVETASAGVLTFYTDRATWLADAAAAGLTVSTQTFSVDPLGNRDFVVGGAAITLSAVPYDVANQRIGFLSGGGRGLSFDITGTSVPLFGFGTDMGPTTGAVRTTDLDGDSRATGASGPAGHFVGLLGTVALDPANPFPANPALAGSSEWGTSGLVPSVWLDNLSVATDAASVTAPATLALVGVGLVGLGWTRRRLAA
jgi:hypothetical protein